MSTKTTNTGSSQINYDPSSLFQYQGNINQIMPMLRQIATQPFKNPFTQLVMGQGVKSALQQGGNSQKALQSMMKTSGMPGGAANGFQNAMQAILGRQTASGVSQAQQGAMLSGLQRQMQAAGMLSAFTPLLSGENSQSSQTTSGTGTWLPQLIGSAISGAMAAGTGGMSAMAGGSMPFMSGGAPTAVPGMTGMTGLGPGSSWMPQNPFLPAAPPAPMPYLGQ